jgi:nitrogen fixation protein FixH
VRAGVQVAPDSVAGGTRAERPRRRSAGLWPWLPGLILVSLIGGQLVVLMSTLDDPTFSTERDYYRKAVDWDARMARQRASQALGWSSSAVIVRSTRGVARLQVRLADARGRAIGGAALRATVFHNARAARALELALTEAEPGVYAAELGPARAGLWEVRLSASRGSDAYESTLRLDVTGEREP